METNGLSRIPEIQCLYFDYFSHTGEYINFRQSYLFLYTYWLGDCHIILQGHDKALPDALSALLEQAENSLMVALLSNLIVKVSHQVTICQKVSSLEQKIL